MKLSVVIPALDEAERIEAAIRSVRSARAESVLDPTPELEVALETQPSPGLRPLPGAGGSREPALEIVVADGGSRDDTAARARAAGARVVGSPPGRARQLAAGVAAVDGDVVLMLHADTRLPAGWEDAVREALADPRIVGGSFRLRFDERSPGLALIEWGVRIRVALFGLPYGDQALFVRREVLDAVGGIPQVPLMEDVDLVQALKRRGRLAALPLPALTSARRYRQGGTLRTWLRHQIALTAHALGVDRARVASWVDR